MYIFLRVMHEPHCKVTIDTQKPEREEHKRDIKKSINEM